MIVATNHEFVNDTQMVVATNQDVNKFCFYAGRCSLILPFTLSTDVRIVAGIQADQAFYET